MPMTSGPLMAEASYAVYHGFDVPHTRNDSTTSAASEASAAVVVKHRTPSTGLLSLSTAPTHHKATGVRRNAALKPVVVAVGAVSTHGNVKQLVDGVGKGLRAHQQPTAVQQGLGGTYFFKNEQGQNFAILKPCDEEPLAPNNPKGFRHECKQMGQPGLKPTVRIGEAAYREVAAYLLDHDGFAGVPVTTLAHAYHPMLQYGSPTAERAINGNATPNGHPMKLCSLQEFVPHKCDTDEMGSSRFSVKDVHRIGMLDVRLFNTDRHAGNILVCPCRAPSSTLTARDRFEEQEYSLVPIDHGFCLPEALEPPYFEWLHWSQASMPFDAEELKYIAALNTESDIALLRSELPALRPECLRVLEVSTMLLKKGAAAGLSLAEIGSVMSREFNGMEDAPSALEVLCQTVVDDIAHGYTSGQLHAGRLPHSPVRSGTLSVATVPEEHELLFNMEDERQHTSANYSLSPTFPMYVAIADDKHIDSSAQSSPVSPFEAIEFLETSSASDTPRGDQNDNRICMWSDAAFSSDSSDTTAADLHRMLSVETGGCAHHIKCANKMYAARYPPFVAGSLSVNNIFSCEEVGEDEWHVFMQALENHMDAALQSGVWRKRPGLGSVAQSAPNAL